MNARSRRASRYDASTESEWGAAYRDGYEDSDDYYDYDERPRRRERPVGVFSLMRVLLFFVVLIAAGVTFYGLFMAESPTQLPMSITGLALLALSTFLLSISLARAAVKLGRRGRGGKALLAALLGGLFILAASGSAAGAVILTLLVVL